MSGSRRKVPICGMTTAPSDKPFKQAEHRRERAAVKIAVRQDREPPAPKAFGNPACGDKDGKQYCPGDDRLLRK